MTYNEYLSCAEKHLKGCKSLLESYNTGIEYTFAMSNSSIWRYREDIEHNNMKKISK